MGFLCTAGNWTLRRTAWLFADYEVLGKERVPKTGSLIVVANHQSNMDPPILAASVPRRLKFLAKAELFERRWAAFLLNAWGAYPVRRGEADRRAYEWLLGELARPNGAMALFPEGTRTPHSMGRAKRGIATLAVRSNAALLPVGLTGTEGMSNYLRVLNPTGTIRVNIGRPFAIRADRTPASQDDLDALTIEIMARIARLLPEDYRGVYGDAADVDPLMTRELD